MVSNVDRILERAGAATAASAVPVSGGTGKNRANQNRVRDILTRAGAKPVEPEWQAAMFGGTPRYTLSDERYRGILNVDESTGQISVNENAAQTAQELLRQNRELYNSATDEAQKKLYGENMDIYRGVLADLGVEEEGNRLDFGQGIRYTGANLGLGAVQSIRNVANDIGYKVQNTDYYADRIVEMDRLNGGAQARAAQEEYLAGLTQNERDALEITGQIPQGETLLYEKAKREAEERETQGVQPVTVSHMGEQWERDIQNRYGNVEGGWGTAGEVANSVGNQLPSIAIRMVGAGPLADAWFYGSASGAATQEALNEGYSLTDALNYGSVEGIKELATEKLFDGLGGLMGGGAMDNITEGFIGKIGENENVWNVMRFVIGMANEGAEEVVGDLVDPFIKAVTLDKDLKEELDAITLQSLWHDFSLGALSAMAMTGTKNMAQSAAKKAGLISATENDIKNAALRSGAVQKALAEFRETKTGKNLRDYWKAVGAEGDVQSAAAAQNTAEMRTRKALEKAGIKDLTAMEELGFTPTQINTIRAETKIKDTEELQAVLTALKAMDDIISRETGEKASQSMNPVDAMTNVLAPRGEQIDINNQYLFDEHHGGILEVIRENEESIDKMDIVKELDGTEFQKSEGDARSLRQKVLDFFNELGNKVTRAGFGDIALNSAGVRDSLSHGYGKMKAATFAALPEVLQNGKLIYQAGPYEGHDYNSFIFAAPVSVKGEVSYVGALVIEDINTKRYKLHEVLTIKKDGTPSFKTETPQVEQLRNDVPSSRTVSQPSQIVNANEDGTRNRYYMNSESHKSMQDGIPAPRVALAGEEIGPDTRPLTMNNAPAGAEAMKNEGGNINGREQMDTGSTEWLVDNSADIEGKGNAGSFSPQREAADQRRTAESRRDRAVDLSEIGSDKVIPFGDSDGLVKVIPQEMWDGEMTAADQEIFAETGIHVTYVTGDLRGIDTSGRSFPANGCISNGRIVLRADHDTMTVSKLAKHELYHHRETPEMNAAAERKIRKICGKKGFRKIVDTYIKYLPGYSAEQIRSEICADAYAGINAWGNTELSRARETVTENRAAYMNQNQQNGTREIRGPTEWSRSNINDENNSSIKEQIENAKDKLNKMEPVVNLNVPKKFSGKEEAANWAIKQLPNSNFTVDRKGYGIVFAGADEIRNAVRFADTNEEKAAIAAVPAVLKRGIEISGHDNHKNRSKQTITFAAPVVLNGTRGNLAVVVNKRGNKYYAHRIVAPDGTVFKFERKIDAVRESPKGVTVSGSLAKATSTAPKDSVSQENGESKGISGGEFFYMEPKPELRRNPQRKGTFGGDGGQRGRHPGVHERGQYAGCSNAGEGDGAERRLQSRRAGGQSGQTLSGRKEHAHLHRRGRGYLRRNTQRPGAEQE